MVPRCKIPAPIQQEIVIKLLDSDASENGEEPSPAKEPKRTIEVKAEQFDVESTSIWDKIAMAVNRTM